jgi:CRISPR-associated protein Cas1
MPTLIIDGECLSVQVESKRLKVTRTTVEEDGSRSKKHTDIPFHDIERVVVVGRPAITIPALQRLMYNGIPCYFVTTRNRWVGSMQPDGNKDAARRIRQYQITTDLKLRLRIASALIAAKINNSRRVLQRLAANRAESFEFLQKQVCAELKSLVNRAGNVRSLDELRGIEGLAAALYFKRISKFFPKEIPFTVRSRRPPKDPANAILSWTYTIALGEVECAIRTRGLDPCIGFFHEISHGAPCLALDLLEPLRAPLCDLLTLNLLNHNILTDESFEFRSEEGGFFLKTSAHKDFFRGYETAMVRRFTQLKGESHTDFRRVIYDMVSTVLNAMNGDDNCKFFRMP